MRKRCYYRYGEYVQVERWNRDCSCCVWDGAGFHRAYWLNQRWIFYGLLGRGHAEMVNCEGAAYMIRQLGYNRVGALHIRYCPSKYTLAVYAGKDWLLFAFPCHKRGIEDTIIKTIPIIGKIKRIDGFLKKFNNLINHFSLEQIIKFPPNDN